MLNSNVLSTLMKIRTLQTFCILKYILRLILLIIILYKDYIDSNFSFNLLSRIASAAKVGFA